MIPAVLTSHGSPGVGSLGDTARVTSLWLVVSLLAAFLGASGVARAQGTEPAELPENPGIHSPESRTPGQRPPHPFWDSPNLALFAGVAGSRALDFASTRHFRARGNDEFILTNEIVDRAPLFAGIEVAGAATSIGLSYLLHRTGHHTAERWLSFVHVGITGYGAARNFSLK
mgnify:CR=1 FL=1